MWKQRKKYEAPKHPWKKERIDEEHGLAKTYGIRRMKELWKSRAILRNWQRQAKEIISMLPSDKKDKAQEILLKKLLKYGVVTTDADLDDVLGLHLKDVLDKRLETIVHKKGLALTANQARQFIVHGKIMVNGKKLNSPSYMVKEGDEVSYASGFAPILKPEETPNKMKETAEELAEVSGEEAVAEAPAEAEVKG
ncbi:MAG TPA: 30S ribosomal protein S4 [Candidatus Nanoarchaeia archaeon]|nr:30S ribosomal protein S4 [Candidatus Nanoarchaeia archaeon]